MNDLSLHGLISINNGIKLVQHLETTMTTTTSDVTIPTAIDTTKSIIISTVNSVGTGVVVGSVSVTAHFTSSTNIRLTRNGTGNNVEARLLVIEFNNVKSLQTNEVQTNVGTGDLDVDYTITSVDTSKSLVVASTRINDNTNTAIEHMLVSPKLTSSTNLRFSYHAQGGGYTRYFRYYIVEFY